MHIQMSTKSMKSEIISLQKQNGSPLKFSSNHFLISSTITFQLYSYNFPVSVTDSSLNDEFSGEKTFTKAIYNVTVRN